MYKITVDVNLRSRFFVTQAGHASSCPESFTRGLTEATQQFPSPYNISFTACRASKNAVTSFQILQAPKIAMKMMQKAEEVLCLTMKMRCPNNTELANMMPISEYISILPGIQTRLKIVKLEVSRSALVRNFEQICRKSRDQ